MELYLDQVNCSLNRAHGLARQHMETQFGCFACHSGPWNELKLEEGSLKLIHAPLLRGSLLSG